MQEIPFSYNSIIKKHNKFPGIIFVYTGSLIVQAETHEGKQYTLETLYRNCAYGIYQAAKKLMRKDETFTVTNPIKIRPTIATRLYLLP